ncbi:BTAD domain-containing putative transcriptional regulator [Streptomyces sp. WMMC500]|uniref:AfsR/SARP family transcriptional regulator n=1 Tax=Streptomyces sp. WMMC500 TaxID=3015154 RepID=UPI00248B1CE9|nr:BTAD domain-containing putative transcriptional regulator [Streptomyces sp. WMMC500]WBB62057.1 BTAD domain-containing putative transcriptional regulator [Streptomyces sp. WMMC500]
MRYRLLGRVELWDGKKIDVGGPKHRTLLATLLLGANEFQSVDRIAESLWEHDRPRSAQDLVRLYVHQLRKRMGTAGADVLTESGGYMIRVGEGELDIQVFERETRQARRAMTTGDLTQAATRFRTALALWPEPFAVCANSPLVERLRGPRLEDMRLSAVEDLAESELAMGDGLDMVDRLCPLADRHPHRERLLRLLMLALHRRGRKVEALAAFRRTRAFLVSEVGVEPGRELHELVQAILSDDASLRSVADRSTAPQSVRPAQPVPRQVPAGADDLVGRAGELRETREFLAAGTASAHASGRTLLISGPPGVGKSALLFGAAREARDIFPEGELYADLAETSVHEARKDFLIALGVDPVDIPAHPARRLALYRSATAGRRVLVVLDNVVAESQIVELTPTSAGGALVAASDTRLPGVGFTHVLDVEGLDEESGTLFLHRLLGRDRAGGDPGAAGRIVRMCDGVPLALHILGTRLAIRRELTLSEFAGQLADDDGRLGQFRVGDLDLRRRYRRGYERLGRVEQSLFRCLASAEPTGTTVEGLAAMTGQPSAAVDMAVDALVSAHLARLVGRDRAGRPRYRQPLLLRDFARELARSWQPVEGSRCM